MKEKYYEFLNILMTGYKPVRNLNFYLAFLFEILFTSVVLIVSIFTKNQMHNLSIFLIHVTIVHMVIVLLAFLLFQKFSASKLLQSVPTTSFLFLFFELYILWGTVFIDILSFHWIELCFSSDKLFLSNINCSKSKTNARYWA